MSTPAPQQGVRFLLTDCLMWMGAIVGAVSTPVWGYLHYGIIGAVLGIPVGAVLGFVGTFLLLVLFVLAVVGAVSAWTFVRHGRAGVRRLFEGGPDAVRLDHTSATQSRDSECGGAPPGPTLNGD